jgi:hypothetical protein
VGEQFYPSPAARVEYVFGCGCSAPARCDPALAGFDVQLECLARTLRTSLDEITTDGQTAGGWGPGKTTTTLDEQQVTPANAATAVLYQYSPKVGAGSSGNWLFWNIFQNYAFFLDYAGPVGGGGANTWVGEPCKKDTNCDYAGGICADNYPDGMCTAQCQGTDCPTQPGEAETFCANFQTQGGYCLKVCNPTISASCREGYACRKVQRFGNAAETKFVCVVK